MMYQRMSAGEKLFQLFVVGVVSLFCISVLYPFIHILSMSFSTPEAAIRPGIHLVPQEFSLESYRRAFNTDGIWSGYGNTIFRTVVGTAASLLAMTMGAYALSKKWLPHRSFYTLVVVFTMFFNGGLIPTYLMIQSLGLLDSRLALILPCLISTFSMLIMRNFFMSIPEEMEESAKIDGANDIWVLLTIVLPLSKPILATVGLWTAVYHWNAWFDALIYVQDQSKTVLQLYLRRLIIENQTNELEELVNRTTTGVSPETVKSAVLMIATLPIMFVYPFIQKYFVKGIMLGSVKG